MFSISFWQLFIMTVAAVVGFISMLSEGPLLLTSAGFLVTIGVLLWIIATGRREKNTKK